MVVALRFGDTYKARKSDEEESLGVLSRQEIEMAYKVPAGALQQERRMFEKTKSDLIKSFGLKNKKSVCIVPKLKYDCVVDTSKYSSLECARKIKEAQPF